MLLALAAAGTLAALMAVTPEAVAQTDVPDSPTALEVYNIRSGQLEVRWSSSDAASTTSFKIQWKSGSEEFDASRQLTSDPATSIETDQSTSAGERYVEVITDLTDGTEYTVRVIATNANGDSEPSGEVTGTPDSSLGDVKEFIQNEVVELFEGSYPWLRETWDYITAESIPVEFHAGTGGNIYRSCDTVEAHLKKCRTQGPFGGVRIGRHDSSPIDVVTHELAHVYTLANGVAAQPGPLGIAHLYFYDLLPPEYALRIHRDLLSTGCVPSELYADGLTALTHGNREERVYWRVCKLITDAVAVEAVAVAASAVAGELPSWFADTYHDSSGDPDLERVWADVKAIGNPDDRAVAVFQLRNSFGGYCNNQKATESAFGNGVTRNPWRDGGCVPDAPTNVSATAVGGGKLTVSWQEPPYNGGSPIEGYRIRWKSGTQEYSASRQVVVTDLTDLQVTTRALVNDVAQSVGVLAYNHNGDGAVAEITAMPTATDTTAPVLLTARLDREHAELHLTWNEGLDESSVPAASAFTVNVNGVARSHGVSVLGNVVTLHSLGSVSLTDVVTVAYSAPTGPGASPLKDPAGNNAPDLSAQTVRNDRTAITFTSDPGPDETYAWNNGAGTQDVIRATVTFGESVLVTGVPELRLDIGGNTRRATYDSGSGTNALVFHYAVTEGETDADGITVVRGAIEGWTRYASTEAVAPAWVGYESSPAYEADPHFVDAVRPTLLFANILANETELAMKWDKPLDGGSVPAPGDREPTGDPGPKVWDSTARTFLEISAVGVEGNVMTLTLASPVSAGDDLTASYGAPGRNPLKDTVGNYAAHNVSRVAIRGSANSPPEFPTSEDGTRSIDENAPADRNIGTPIAAPDADNDSLTYSISGDDAAFFDVVATSGQLRTRADLDFEDRVSYSFALSVTDGKDVYGNRDTTVDDTINVTITVADVDEGADVSLTAAGGVTANDDALTANDNALTVDENHAGALATFSASDPERKAGLTYTWSLGGIDAADFAISSTGVLSFSSAPDYEGPADSGGNNVYDITVDALDSDGKTGTIAVSIEVADVNDPPTFPSPADTRRVFQDAEAGENVGTPVAAWDVDANDALMYSLFGPDAGSFDIDPRSGQITVGDGITFDIEDTFEVIVAAEDQERASVSIDLTITVTTRPVAPLIIGGGGGPSGPSPSEVDFEWTVEHDIEELDAGHHKPSGMWSDGVTLWLLQNGSGADDAVYAYDLAAGGRVEDREFSLAEANRAPRGAWSNSSTLWVSDSGQERLFAYDLATGQRDEEREFALAGRNRDARGTWSDGETIWVLDGGKNSLFAYDLASGTLLAEYRLASANDQPHGIWSDGVSVWVSNHDPKRLFAYGLPDAPNVPAADDAEPMPLERTADLDFTELSRAGNNSPRDIWSDGAAMYVADENDGKVYSYNMPDAIDARLASLELSGVDIGEFSPLRYDYASETIPHGNIATLTVVPAQEGATVRIDPPDHDGDPANGHHLRLLPGLEITVAVTSPDGSRERVYRLLVGDEEPAGEEDAAGPAPDCLRGAVAVGFSLVVYEGGSVEELVACAEGRHVTALYALHEGTYEPYILGAPDLVNQRFGELYTGGVPALTPLTVKSDGPATADPGAPVVLEPWAECLRGEIVEGFSLVLYEGGSVEALAGCAEGLGVGALYVLDGGTWVSYILRAPEFVNRSFRELFPDDVPGATPLTVRGEEP